MKKFIYTAVCSLFVTGILAASSAPEGIYGNIKLPDESCIRTLVQNDNTLDKKLSSKIDKLIPLLFQILSNTLKGQILQIKLPDSVKQNLQKDGIVANEHIGNISFTFANNSITFSIEQGKPTLTFMSPTSRTSYIYDVKNCVFTKSLF